MDKDVTGRFMPSLAYVSREKSKASNHHFEAGAQNVLVRKLPHHVVELEPRIVHCDCFFLGT